MKLGSVFVIREERVSSSPNALSEGQGSWVSGGSESRRVRSAFLLWGQADSLVRH